MKITRRSVMAGLAMTGSMGAARATLAAHRMPTQDAPHTRTFMQWPVREGIYGKTLLARVRAEVALIAKTIATFEEVVMLVADGHAASARALLGDGIPLWNIPTDDLWARDSGPTFVVAGGKLAVVEIAFNGWGGKQEHGADRLVAPLVAKKLGVPYLKTGLVGEQGGFTHDGTGLVLAHASSWVNDNRNSGSEEKIGNQLLKAIGGKKMIWAPGLIGADITDCHIDALARFVAPGRVLIQMPAFFNQDDPWSWVAYETMEVLKGARTLEGNPLDILVVPEPTQVRSRVKRFVASYVNHYVCNDAVICSEFGDKKADGRAREVLQELYPRREIMMLNTDALSETGGGIHCATQQQPKV